MAAGSWPGAGAATGRLLIDSAIARTGVLPRSPCSLRFLARARRPSSGGGGVVAGRRCSYGEAADRQRDRANGGLAAFPMLSAFSRRARGGRHQVAAGSWPGAGAATGRLRIDSAIALTGVWPCGCFCSGILLAPGRWRARSNLALKITPPISNGVVGCEVARSGPGGGRVVDGSVTDQG